MSVSQPQDHDKLVAENVKGNPLGKKVRCSKCGKKGCLCYTGRFVKRSIVVRDDNGNAVHKIIPIPLCKCQCCGGRIRVLPADILPYKTFSLSLIAQSLNKYTHSKMGLRKTAEDIGGNAQPDHSTIWHWLKDMGERVSDRADLSNSHYSLPTCSSLIEESARRIDSAIREIWRIIPKIACWKCKSESRRDQLEACARLIDTAKSLFPDNPDPLLQWHRVLMPFFNVPPWCFFT
jgi:hypothetical protein